MPIDTFKNICGVALIVEPDNYVLVINAKGTKLDSESLKKVTKTKSLLESICNSKIKENNKIVWKVLVV